MSTRPRRSSVAGFVLRLARESIPATQAVLAEALRVDLDTLQGWETGRRPLAHVRASVLLAVRRRLPALGADPALIQWLDAAMDADRILAVGLTGHDEADEHPLAGWVHTRATAHMLAWALDGTAPPALADHLGKAGRRGPVARSPHLSAPERASFFDHLRNVSEHPDAAPGSLLRRQSLYLASYDQAPDTAAWTALGLRHRTGSARGGSPQWAETRSVATALARLGDPQPLLTFIERGMHDDDAAEAANLNYMALWHSALGTPQADDHFMLDQSLSGWDPLTLLRQLATRVTPSPGFVDLHAHSLWALVEAYPWLPMAAPRLGPHLRSEVSRLLDGPGLSPRARRELAHIHYIFDTNR